MIDPNRCVAIDCCFDLTIQDGFRCTKTAVRCPMPGCSAGGLTDTCLKHMDERNGQKMCQECCHEFDNPEVMP